MLSSNCLSGNKPAKHKVYAGSDGPPSLSLRLLLLLAGTLVPLPSHAQEAPSSSLSTTQAASQDTVWTIGLQGSQLALKSGDGNHLLGFSTAVQLGRGWIGTNWYANVSLDIISGPYQSPKQQDLVVDFSGTGGSAFIAYSAENQSLRTFQGNYGFLLGVTYQDVVGRSVGRRVSEVQGVAVDNWVMRVNNFSLFPAVFFTWLQSSAREAKRNDPQSLMTRIEGYFLTIGISTPMRATYSLHYNEDDIPMRSRGDLRGYTLVISVSTLLGV